MTTRKPTQPDTDAPPTGMATPCANCGHPYGEHSPGGCAMPGPTCDCPGFGGDEAAILSDSPPTPDDDFEDMLAGFDRILTDKALQQQLLDAGLLVRADPPSDSPRPPTTPQTEARHVTRWIDAGSCARAVLARLAAAPPEASDHTHDFRSGHCTFPGCVAPPEASER